MKFGQRLRAQNEEVFGGTEAEDQSLDYKQLKKAISALKSRIDAGEMTQAHVDASVRAWLDAFEREVMKFDKYFNEAARVCEEEVLEFEDLMDAHESVEKGVLKEAYLKLQELKFFVELNREGTRKILKKMNKNVPFYDTTEWYELRARGLSSFQSDPLQETIGRLTAVYAAVHLGHNLKLAEMQLDYFVQSNSDVFSYMLENGENRDSLALEQLI